MRNKFDLKNSYRVCLYAFGFIITLAAAPVNAAIIHESATLGSQTGEGLTISDTQYVGSRFSLNSTFHIDSVGGHVVGLEGHVIFAAIVSLSSPTAFPSGTPPDLGGVVASTTLTASYPSVDILTPLNVILGPGDYALVFGSGLFGATGSGAMTFNNPLLPGASFFTWNTLSDGWANDDFHELRFVVTGTAVPVPPAIWLFGSGLMGLIGIARGKKA